MHILRCWLIAALLALAMPGSAGASEAADRAALEAATQAFIKAFNARDESALLRLVSKDVVLLGSGSAPVSGAQAARTAWQQAFGLLDGKVSAATKELVITGDVAWRIGALADTLPSGEVAERGQSLEIWKRVQGQWQLHRLMASSILLAQPFSRPSPSQPVLDAPRN